MGQRVNIQYSVEIDDLDEEVARLFKKAVTQLEDIGSGWGSGYIPLDLEGLRMVDELRQNLARIDIALGDVQNIVQGYVNYKSAPQQEQPDSPSGAEGQEIQELEDRIAMFKEMIDAQPNQEPEEDNE
jgi:hypothetical protein